MQKTAVDPASILEALLAKGPRSNKARNLHSLHQICRRQFENTADSLRDFSLSSIGRICEAQGVFKARVLYNAASADYVALITAWAAYSGPSSVKAPKELKVPASHEYLIRIGDPAIRQLMQTAIAERDSLKAQVNLLKSQMQIVVDKRPLGATITKEASSIPILLLKARLTDSERTALGNAISSKHLERVGLIIGPRGEIKSVNGKTVFDVGFVDAIQKILEVR